MFTFSGTWQGKQTQSTFGHLYLGQRNATLSYEFTGTRLALLSSSKYGQNFEVTIDGRKVNSIDLKEDNNVTSVTYISQELENTSHHVVIKCLGEANIDCVVTY